MSVVFLQYVDNQSNLKEKCILEVLCENIVVDFFFFSFHTVILRIYHYTYCDKRKQLVFLKQKMVRKPARWAKTGFKPFFAKMIEMVVLLVVPNPLLICFPTQWDRHTEYNSPCTCVAHKPGAINKNTFETMCFPTWLQWCFCCLYRLCCLYVFFPNGTEI